MDKELIKNIKKMLQEQKVDTFDFVHEILKEEGTVAVIWSILDVTSVRPDLNKEQAMKVLEIVKRSHDSNYGITWDTLKDTANNLYPELM